MILIGVKCLVNPFETIIPKKIIHSDANHKLSLKYD